MPREPGDIKDEFPAVCQECGGANGNHEDDSWGNPCGALN